MRHIEVPLSAMTGSIEARNAARNRAALEVFSHSFPLEYPEIETLVVLQRKRFRFIEVPCSFRARTTGRTSITPSKSLYFILHVMLGVFVNILRFDGRRR